MDSREAELGVKIRSVTAVMHIRVDRGPPLHSGSRSTLRQRIVTTRPAGAQQSCPRVIKQRELLKGTMSAVQVVKGFSLTNRWLLYTSFMLAPAQFVSGIGNNCPSNIGFLAYNWYTQISWYRAAQANEFHALALLTSHFNLIYTFSYIGGITSGNIIMGTILGLGTAGVMILNTVTSWISWSTLPSGFGDYEFFFFGWRTLNPDWYKLFLCWQIFDSIAALGCIVAVIATAVTVSSSDDEEGPPWYARYTAIPVGAASMLLAGWPLILWTELIMARNHMESATDWIAVWLFIAQAGTLLMPSCPCS